MIVLISAVQVGHVLKHKHGSIVHKFTTVNKHTPVLKAIDFMKDFDVGGALVIDESNRAIGTFGEGMIIECAAGMGLEKASCGELMMPNKFVCPNDDIFYCLSVMLSFDVSYFFNLSRIGSTS
jgi:hypothetical protein